MNQEWQVKQRLGALDLPRGVARWAVSTAEGAFTLFSISLQMTSGHRRWLHFGSTLCSYPRTYSEKDIEWLNDWTKPVYYEHRLLL